MLAPNRLFALLMPMLLTSACASSRAHAPLGTLVAASDARGAVAASAMNQPNRRHIIHSARLVLEDKRVGKIAQRAAAVARQVGGHVAHSHNRGDRVQMRLRVPAPRFATVVARLERLAEVTSRQIRGENVTTQVVDLDLRLRTALEARKRYLELLARANSVSDALLVQKELQKVVAEIEQLKAQIARIKRRVRLATIEVVIKRPVRPGVVGWIFYGVYRGVKWLFVWD